jgi:pimeloyl-ACP methyl ester carboxylesterase
MPTTHELSIEGHKLVALGFNEDKPGTPVIFLHGIGSSTSFWLHGQVAIFNERRWYSLSLPGHFPAQLPTGFRREDMTAEMIARVLAEAVRKLVGDEPVMLVGYSTGGFAALAIAAQYPAMVKSVISVAGFVQGVWTGPFASMQRLARRGKLGEIIFHTMYKVFGSSLPLFRNSWNSLAADRQALLAFPELPVMVEASFPNARRLDSLSMLYYFNRMPDIDISSWLAKINAPVLALAGDRDPIVPTAQSRLIAGKVPNSTLAMIEGAGHLPMLERPDEYSKLVTEWVERWG